MPNLQPPITTAPRALAYRERICAARDRAAQAVMAAGDAHAAAAIARFAPLMTMYLTDRTLPADIDAAKQSGVVHGIKLYPAGATTHSDAGVTDLSKLDAVLEAMDVARAARHRALENFAFAALYNLIAGPAAMLGMINPFIAALAMSGSSLVVTLNALRLLRGDRK